MALPTISLALIAKNEEKNINRLLDSVEGCFHEIVLVDTGSTDRTKEIALERGCKVFDFEWVNDFSKARNFAFSKTTKDYVVWMDLDDCLSDREAFINWRDNAMEFVDCWFGTYAYALDQDGKPIISFVRERAFRKSLNPTWQYPIHEGVIAMPEWSKNYVTSWRVNHMRDAEDIAQDKSRNLKILEEIQDKDPRLTFYYGKELYEGGKVYEAIAVLDKASKLANIEHHDRILALQYAAYACMGSAGQLRPELKIEIDRLYRQAIDYCHQGIKLDSNRAEFHTTLGDCLVQMGNLQGSIPYFAAAKHCFNPKDSGSKYEGAIYNFVNCYGEMPSLQLSKIYFHLGQMDKAIKEASECVDKYNNEEAKAVLLEAERVNKLITLDQNQEKVPDIVFSCPPQSMYEFDEEIYKTKGMGGSETALIEMARNLKEITGRPVKVFNMRQSALTADSGVEYISNSLLNDYLSKHSPAVHIAWRHNIRVTNAPTYLWCHDLFTQGVESNHGFDKIMCLTPFHKNYVKGLQGVPDDKIIVTRNGLTPDKFNFERKVKNPNKSVWMSSPDRGLDRAMYVMDEVIKDFPDMELHVYYGIEGLYKYGPQMSALADHLKKMMSERPYVKYHGFTEQNKMYQEVSDAVLWCHPCNFIETSCITAMEMLALGIYPVTRKLGGLKDTLADAEAKGHAILLDHDATNPQEIKAYANAVCGVILNRSWERIDYDIQANSWKQISKEWVEFMNL